MIRIPVSIDTIRGPWFSLGVHVDFQQRYVDIHFVWWIITIGDDYWSVIEDKLM